jgi:hypothetical protein
MLMVCHLISGKHITPLLFGIIATYAAIYGVTYAYLLHHLVNVVALWLVCLHFFGSGFSLRNLHQTIRSPDPEKDEPLGSDGHLKKLP